MCFLWCGAINIFISFFYKLQVSDGHARSESESRTAPADPLEEEKNGERGRDMSSSRCGHINLRTEFVRWRMRTLLITLLTPKMRPQGLVRNGPVHTYTSQHITRLL